MTKISWESVEKRQAEWAFAKAHLIHEGKLLPNGSKLRHKEYSEQLDHSFLVIDNRIVAMARGYLSEGEFENTKLAEDESGNLIVLKIFFDDISFPEKEAKIAHDLGLAGQLCKRENKQQNFPQAKKYLAYQYLGTRLDKYLDAHRDLSLDRRFELCIWLALELHDLHQGKQAKSGTKYCHGDLSLENVVIDNQARPHIINYRQAMAIAEDNQFSEKADIINLLLLFSVPPKYPKYKREMGILGYYFSEYQISYDDVSFDEKNPRIYIYLDPEEGRDNIYLSICYTTFDLQMEHREGRFFYGI